jgi:hypothetical protein
MLANMMSRPNAVPLRPDWSARDRASDHLVRAVAAIFLAKTDFHRRHAEDIAAERWPRDDQVPLLLKAASAPATVTTSGWASQLAATSVADFILGLGPASAGAELLKHGLTFSFDSTIKVPGLVAAAADVAFVQEGAPIKVEQLAVDGVTLQPRSLPVIAVFSRECLSHSTPNIEMVARATLSESVAAALDLALFDAAAGDATRPAGLRYNIAGIGASTATPSSEAMSEDVPLWSPLWQMLPAVERSSSLPRLRRLPYCVCGSRATSAMKSWHRAGWQTARFSPSRQMRSLRRSTARRVSPKAPRRCCTWSIAHRNRLARRARRMLSPHQCDRCSKPTASH